MPGCYLNEKYTKYIEKNKIDIIFEIGSRDCLDAINLNKYNNKKVYSFECNPQAIDICLNNLTSNNISSDQVELCNKAVFNKNEEIEFFPVVKTDGAETKTHVVDFFKTGDNTYANIGASSIFKINKDYQKTKYKNDNYHQQNKKPIKIPATRLDTFMESKNLDKIDLICMDLQGAELMALEGMGDYLKKTKYIITELCTSVEKNGKIIENYEGQGNIKKVFKLLKKNGFKKILGNENRFSHDDFLFINNNI